MTRVTKKDLSRKGVTDAEVDDELAPVGATLDPGRNWSRETCSTCGVEALVDVPDEVEVAKDGDRPLVRWDCSAGHRNAVEAARAVVASAPTREVSAGEAGEAGDRG